MTFSEALEEMKKGQSIRRSIWSNPKEIYLWLKITKDNKLFMQCIKGVSVGNFLMNSRDILANDWEIAP